jgi:hypothetical protein
MTQQKIKLQRLCLKIKQFYQNYLAVRNTADVTRGNPIAVLSQSIWSVNAINPLVTVTTFIVANYSFILSRTPHDTDL